MDGPPLSSVGVTTLTLGRLLRLCLASSPAFDARRPALRIPVLDAAEGGREGVAIIVPFVEQRYVLSTSLTRGGFEVDAAETALL